MTDQEIIDHLKSGGTCNFGMNGHNMEIIELMADLEQQGLIETWDASLSQETRRAARWVAPKEQNDD